MIFARRSWKRTGLRLEEHRIERMVDLDPADALQASRDDCPFIPRVLLTDIKKDVVGGGVSSSDDSNYLVTLATYRRAHWRTDLQPYDLSASVGARRLPEGFGRNRCNLCGVLFPLMIQLVDVLWDNFLHLCANGGRTIDGSGGSELL